MKIDPTGTARPAVIRRDSPASAGRFTPASTGETIAAGTRSVSLLSSIDGLFALQEIADPLERRRRGLRYGHTMLDHLEALRLGLLTGSIDGGTLIAMRAAAAEQREQTDDPGLDEVLGHIGLRVAVELAKRDR